MLELEPGKIYRYYTPSFLNLPLNEEVSYADYISTRVREEITPYHKLIDKLTFFRYNGKVLTESDATIAF